MFAHRIDLADIRAGAKQCAGHCLFFRERKAGGGRDPVGRCAARHQHQHEIIRARGLRQFECVRGRVQARFIRHRMPCLDHLDHFGRASIAMARDRDPRHAFARHAFRFEIMPLGGLGHRARGLVGSEQDQSPGNGRFRQERRQADGRMRGGDRLFEQAFEEAFGLDAHKVTPAAGASLAVWRGRAT